MKFADVKKQIKEINTHDKVVIEYNKMKPLPEGYVLKVSDDWCAAYVSVILYKAGYKRIIECSVPRMILLARAAGIYKTSGYKPKKGDLVIYDWDDIKDGDHIGIITDIDNIGFITVKEGNKAGSIGVRSLPYEDGRVTAFISIPYDKEENASVGDDYKTVDDIVNAIIKGSFGNGDKRKEMLYNYFQKKVNEKLS